MSDDRHPWETGGELPWESECAEEHPWESGGDLPWESGDDDSPEEAAREAWRGDLHTGAWPEDMAGPEYWMFRRDRDEEE